MAFYSLFVCSFCNHLHPFTGHCWTKIGYKQKHELLSNSNALQYHYSVISMLAGGVTYASVLWFFLLYLFTGIVSLSKLLPIQTSSKCNLLLDTLHGFLILVMYQNSFEVAQRRQKWESSADPVEQMQECIPTKIKIKKVVQCASIILGYLIEGHWTVLCSVLYQV